MTEPAQPPQPVPAPVKASGKTRRIIVAGAGGLLLVLLLGVVLVFALRDKGAADSAEGWADVTATRKEAALGVFTIKGNPEWEPIVQHIAKAEYDKTTQRYRVYLDLSAAEARRQFPDSVFDPGTKICIAVQLADDSSGGITVFGSDGTKMAQAIGAGGNCEKV
ncbi:hypothetical protein [Longispora urticae]